MSTLELNPVSEILAPREIVTLVKKVQHSAMYLEEVPYRIEILEGYKYILEFEPPYNEYRWGWEPIEDRVRIFSKEERKILLNVPWSFFDFCEDIEALEEELKYGNFTMIGVDRMAKQVIAYEKEYDPITLEYDSFGPSDYDE
ncbi:hypothetical protein A3A14_01805 [Candidatus Daviesbacteria bacterium RIFCSPLOWO2_01_FULL_43_38]|uniref:Uncharacterized protein n=3 Tax=Candidatus Daviesiibacteriota TaxID=1752718 RepID=A0A1F5K516_9BACT|nr:MAG: hypothetical protein UV33_C0023G0003 [Candidatus Daviesbacteria bacterium GW2011_GWA1_42_6]KKS69145.1 MAG: hypothetical protein UV41_C0063G0003 [Candidatus Daviesbacteria bacterium GW2011_GWA2_42_7]OGE20173.1 MAG: hypothetical protein A2874_03315 [Candidatus Daviesbacteria bacterium RIFCSPHIGHO2_01_FULL_43_17]OGE36062.1 MAG: hypothetical protein A3E45_03970 [Candidatus Daviesbacteria bacterium RIFCSPHIGHO2_12_FULL_43_11]OGE63976.1 MAG: hypothetical protein A3A14_01805 [Candidatus Davies